jgi:serine/threonine protein kinase
MSGANLDRKKSEIAVDTPVEANDHRLDNRGQETLLKITEPRVPLPELSWDDVAIGGLLGTGTFSSVNKVKLLKVISNAEDGTTLLHKNKEYALKQLQPAVRNDEKAKVYAAKDLLFEATILAQLPAHENIIQLHAVSSNFWDRSDGQGFLVLDHLVETLHFRLIRLKASLKANPIPRGIPFFNRSARQLQRRDQQSRITNIALGVARGMKFLHSHRIIYRDLKPATSALTNTAMFASWILGYPESKPAKQLSGD